MHSRLTVILSQQHIADLHRAAGHDRLVNAATTAAAGDHATASHRGAATALTFVRRLRHRAARRSSSRSATPGPDAPA